MSTREKKLLSLFALAGLVILSVILFSFYQQKKVLLEGKLKAAEAKLTQTRLFEKSAEQYAEEIVWLNENEPEPMVYQTAQNEIEKFTKTQAENFGLTFKTPVLLATDTSGKHFHIAKYVANVTGKEEDVYKWLHAINDPAEFRAAIEIVLNPNKPEDTLIDCKATVAKWFPPLEDEL